MNEIVLQIKKALEENREPMTIPELADYIKTSRQTVNNHLKEAVIKGYAVPTGIKRGKAPLYASPQHNSVKYFSIPWGFELGKREAFQTLFLRWANNTPGERTIHRFVLTTRQLYRLAAEFAQDEGKENTSYTEKSDALKDQRAKLSNYIELLEMLLRASNMLYNSPVLWNPKDLVQTLILNDPDITVAKIRAAFDTPKEKD